MILQKLPFKLNSLKGTRTAFLTPKRYDDKPRPFYMEVAAHCWAPDESPPGSRSQHRIKINFFTFFNPGASQIKVVNSVQEVDQVVFSSLASKKLTIKLNYSYFNKYMISIERFNYTSNKK